MAHYTDDECWTRVLLLTGLIGALGTLMIPGAAAGQELDFPSVSNLPPTSLSGSVGYTTLTQEAGDRPREYRNLVTGSVMGTTYVWQPWFTTVDGTMNLTQDTTTGGTAETDSAVVTGSASVNVLPLSNFPTNLSYLRSDSSVDGTQFTSQTTTERASIANRVFLPDPRLTIATAGAMESTARTNTGAEDVLLGSMDVTKGFDTSTLNMKAKHDESVFTPTSGGSGNDRVHDLLNVRHDYQPFERVYVQSSSTVLRSEETIQNTGRDTFYIQGVTSGQWRPEEVPLTVNGAFRTLTQSLELGAASTDTQSIAGTVGANYVIAPRLTSNFGLNSNIQSVKTTSGAESGETSSFESERQDATVSTGVNYYSLPEDIAGFSWNWDTSGAAQAGYTSLGEGSQSLSSSLGHSASRSLDVPLVGISMFSANQQGRASHTADGTIPAVSHSVGLTRSFSENQVRTYIRLSGSDTRELAGADQSSFQLLNAQANGVGTIDADSEWQANFSLQTARQTFRDRDSGFNSTAVGSSSYFKREVFGVRNLGFRSDLIINASGFSTVTAVESQRLSEKIDSQWNNQFEYRIGKITMKLQGRLFRTNGELGNLILFNIVRRFV